MKFWIIESDREGTIGCELSRRAALEFAAERGYDDASVRWIDVPVTADSIRRLLGNLGGFAVNWQDE